MSEGQERSHQVTPKQILSDGQEPDVKLSGERVFWAKEVAEQNCAQKGASQHVPKVVRMSCFTKSK